MIASVTGRLASTGLDWVVVEVGGIGMRLSVTPGTVSDLVSRSRSSSDSGSGSSSGSEPVCLSTSLIVREDALTLYGFGSDRERETFEVLLSVSGIGPRIALAALSVLSPEELSEAISSEDLAVLQRIPGIGKKSAQRMVLEIGGKLSSFAAAGSVSEAAPSPSAHREEVEAALEQLGWTKAIAAKTLDQLEGDFTDASSLLRAALMRLGNSRG